MNSKITKAIIPAAGLGTRFLPITKSVSKEMLPIYDKPALQYTIEECVNAGITDIAIVTHRSKTDIEKYITANNDHEKLKDLEELLSKVNISFMYQHKRRGLGDAVSIPLMKGFIDKDEDVAVLLPDELILCDGSSSAIGQLIDCHKSPGVSLAVKQVNDEDVSQYGIAGYNENGQLCTIIEKPDISQAPSNFASIGRYIIPYDILSLLKQSPVGVNGEIQLTDSINQLIKSDQYYSTSYEIKGERFDTGQIRGYMEAQQKFYERGEIT